IDEVGIIFKGSEFILAYFFKLIGFFSLCLFFGMLLKRSAFALAFLFVEWLFEWFVFWGAYEALGGADQAQKVKNFLPLESMYNLINQPIQRIIMSMNPDKENFLYD